MRTKKTALSERQEQVMTLLIEGYTPSGIAEKLYISESCAKLHMQSIYKKLGFQYTKGMDMKVRAIIKYLKMKGALKDV